VRVFDAYLPIHPQTIGNVIQKGNKNSEPGNLDTGFKVAIGTLPVTREGFGFWKPEFILSQASTDVERKDLSQALEAAEPWSDLQYP
jgi:hypothetical protein